MATRKRKELSSITWSVSTTRSSTSGIDLDYLKFRHQLPSLMNQDQQKFTRLHHNQDIQLPDCQKQQIAQELATILTNTGCTEINEELLQRLVRQAIAKNVTTSYNPEKGESSTTHKRHEGSSSSKRLRKEVTRDEFNAVTSVNCRSPKVTFNYDLRHQVTSSNSKPQELTSNYDRPHTISQNISLCTQSPTYNRPSVGYSNYNSTSYSAPLSHNIVLRSIPPDYDNASHSSSPVYDRCGDRDSSPRADSTACDRFSCQVFPFRDGLSRDVTPSSERKNRFLPNFDKQNRLIPNFDRQQGFIPNFDKRRENSVDVCSIAQPHFSVYPHNISCNTNANNRQNFVAQFANSFSKDKLEHEFERGNSSSYNGNVNLSRKVDDRSTCERQIVSLMSINPMLVNGKNVNSLHNSNHDFS